jgi:hypothetical protein
MLEFMDYNDKLSSLKPVRIFIGGLRLAADWKRAYILRNTGMLYEEGWWESARRRSAIDRDGKPIPWLTYPCIRFLKERVTEKLKVFEYGCGNSTLWWAKMVDDVVSCEHDKEWFEKTRTKTPSNVTLIHKELVYGGEYCEVIASYNNCFDIVVIDGRDRVRCAKNSILSLRKGGILIWDDTERERYNNGIKHLIQEGFNRIDFWGMRPIYSSYSCTSIFYKKENCLGI